MRLLTIFLLLPFAAQAADLDSFDNVTTLPATCEFIANDPIAGALRNVQCSALDDVVGEHLEQAYCYALSDNTTALTTGATDRPYRVPYALNLTGLRAYVDTAPTGAALTVDINEDGSTILSTKLTIDADEKTSTTAAAAHVFSDTAIADDAVISFDLDTVGSAVAGAGLVVCLYGTK